MADKSFEYVQKDNDVLGTDILRVTDKTVPMQFRSSIIHTLRQSANGSNYNQTVDVRTPIVRIVDGLSVSTDAFKATLKFSALQHVVNDGERFLAFDALIAYAIANRVAIVTGSKSATTAPLTVSTTVPA